MELATPAPLLPPNGQAPDTLKEYISFLSAPYHESLPSTSGTSSNLEASAEAGTSRSREDLTPNVVTLDSDDDNAASPTFRNVGGGNPFSMDPDNISSDENEEDFEERHTRTPSPPQMLEGELPTPPTSPRGQQPQGGLLDSPTADALAAGDNPLPLPPPPQANPLPPQQGQAAAMDVPDQQADDRQLERACKNAKSYRILKRKEKVKTMREIQKKSQAITAYLEAKTRALNAQFPPPQNDDNHEPF